MCTALTNDNPFDVCPTGGTGLSGAIINTEIILEFTATIDPVNGCAIAANTFLQDCTDRFTQSLSLFDRNGIDAASGFNFARCNDSSV